MNSNTTLHLKVRTTSCIVGIISTNIYTLDFGNFHIPLPGVGGFLPAVKQIANVAALPGIVGVSHAPFS